MIVDLRREAGYMVLGMVVAFLVVNGVFILRPVSRQFEAPEAMNVAESGDWGQKRQVEVPVKKTIASSPYFLVLCSLGIGLVVYVFSKRRLF